MKFSAGQWLPRWTLTAVLALGAIVSIGFLLVPYSEARRWIDTFADDGSADPFTVPLFRKLQAVASLFGMICALLAASLCLAHRSTDEWVQDLFLRLLYDFRRTILPMVCIAQENMGWLVVVTVVGIGMRLPWLTQPLRYDEATTWLCYASQPWFITMSKYDAPNNHVAHSLLMQLSLCLFGENEWSLRLPAFVAGCLMVPFTGFLALRIAKSRWAGVLASLIVAGSSPLIEYSTNARGYTLVGIVSLGIWTLAVPAVVANSTCAWLGIVVLTAFGMWTIPVMLIPAVASWWWLAIAGVVSGYSHVDNSCGRASSPIKSRVTSWCLSAVNCTFLTAILYVPVLIVSGPKVIIGNTYVLPMSLKEWWDGMGLAAFHAESLLARDWGFRFLWACVFGGLGVCSLLSHSKITARFRGLAVTSLFVSLALIAVQRVHPPGRVWLFLIPWSAVIASCGFREIVNRLSRVMEPHTGATRARWIVNLAWVAAMIFTAIWPASNGVRFEMVRHSIETEVAQGSPLVIRYLKQSLLDREAIIAACPASAPLVYYAHREGIDLRHFHMPFTPEVRDDSAVIVTAHCGGFDQTPKKTC